MLVEMNKSFHRCTLDPANNSGIYSNVKLSILFFWSKDVPDNIVKQLMLISLFVKENFSLVSVTKMATGSPKQTCKFVIVAYTDSLAQ